MLHSFGQAPCPRHRTDQTWSGRGRPVYSAYVSPRGKSEPTQGAPSIGDIRPAVRAMHRATHPAIAEVTEVLDGFAFNVVVVRLHEPADEFENARTRPAGTRLRAAQGAGDPGSPRDLGDAHINDENYARLQSAFAALVAGMPCPQPDSVLLAMDTVTIAEQITGKLRYEVAAPWTRRPTLSLQHQKETRTWIVC